tara:strand:- start:6157 stop:6666 length:510 start_codon:yes stop_codon:yes gene_type:complete
VKGGEMISVMTLLFTLVGNGASLGDAHTQTVVAYERGDPRPLYAQAIHQRDRRNKILLLSMEAAEQFREMMVRAAKDGFHLQVISAFRTHREQRILRKRKGDIAALPGWSNHQQGLSVDLAGTTRKIKGKRYRTILYWWLVRNAKKYGFYNDVPNEPWHWTYKGVRAHG